MKTWNLAPRANMVKATPEDLRSAGIPFTGVVLRIGQVIQFPAKGDMDLQKQPLGQSQVIVVKAAIDGVLQWVPMGAFNKTPTGDAAVEFLDKYPVNREICAFPNFEEAGKAYEGKSLKVIDVVDGPKPFFVRGADGKYVRGHNADNSPATQPGKFPVFEWTNNPE